MFEKTRLDKINENLSVYQITDGLLFGTDALLLAYFICADKTLNSRKKINTAIEFGTGSGVISLLTAKKLHHCINHIFALEIQKIYCELAVKNIELNLMTEKITVIEGDLKDLKNQKKLPPDSAEMVFSNPPYMNNHGIMSESQHKNIAKHEICCNISDVLKSANRLLKDKGDFYCVYPAERLQELFSVMEKNNIYPKIITFVHPKENLRASLTLIKGKKSSNHGLYVSPPLVLADANGNMTEQAKKMYADGIISI